MADRYWVGGSAVAVLISQDLQALGRMAQVSP
jgi:hypothetical protein